MIVDICVYVLCKTNRPSFCLIKVSHALVSLVYYLGYMVLNINTLAEWAIQKKSKLGTVEDILFWAETCANSGKLCDTPGKFQDRKTRHMEIPHDMSFSWTPLEILVLS